MSLDKKSKVYGLIIPKKPGEASKAAENISATIKRPSIFNDDSSDDDGFSDDDQVTSVKTVHFQSFYPFAMNRTTD
jgi:hypothetical protein